MTLKSRLVVSIFVVLAVLGIAAVAVARSQRGYLIDQVDQSLAQAVPQAVGFAERVASPTPRPTSGPSSEERPPPGPTALSELYVGRINTDGSLTTVFAPGLLTDIAPRVPAGAMNLLPTAPDGRRFGRSQPFDIPVTGSSEHLRVVLVAPPDSTGTLVVGLPLTRVQDAYQRLLWGLAAGGLFVIVLGALAAWWVIRLGLRPIRAVTDAADAIARGELDRRVAVPPARTEAGHLARAFNLMLDERQAAEDRLRRFVGDASHELRTPLTSIRGYVELYRKGGLRGERELDDAMRRVAQESHRMEELVDDLLLLARLDQGRPLGHEHVDLSAILADAAADAAAVNPGRPIRAEVETGLYVLGDEARLRQVLAGVVTNALVHTLRPTPVVVRGRRTSTGGSLIEVEDHGDGMTPEVAARAFERFYRGDPSRSRHRGGSGLGLAIVQSIVDAHGGRVALESAPGRGTLVRIVLPGAPSSAAGRAESGELAPGGPPPGQALPLGQAVPANSQLAVSRPQG